MTTKYELECSNEELTGKVAELECLLQGVEGEHRRLREDLEARLKLAETKLETVQRERDNLLSVASARETALKEQRETAAEQSSRWLTSSRHEQEQREALVKEHEAEMARTLDRLQSAHREIERLTQLVERDEDLETLHHTELQNRTDALDKVRQIHGPISVQDAMKLADYITTGMISA